MQPFVLPEFYRPYPARLNAHVNQAREHTKAWAMRLGMIGDGSGVDDGVAWTEQKFDAMDFALLCGYGYPDAPGPRLELVTDWYVWQFYVEDYLGDAFKQTRELTGVKRYLERLLAFMPTDVAVTPRPENPAEQGLADLWARTAPIMSTAWLRRYVRNLRDAFHEGVREMARVREDRIPDPIECLHMRRKVGGVLSVADLIEVASGTEIPDDLIVGRPLRVLRETVADAIDLHNDIYSYRREIELEGDVNNCVLAFQHFLGCDVHEAVELTNDLLTSRLHQFENTALIELPQYFDDNLVSPVVRSDILGYAKGLRDLESGSHEWHVLSGRHGTAAADGVSAEPVNLHTGPNSVGTQAPRLFVGLGSRDPGPFELPTAYMPFKVRLNPHFDELSAHNAEWMRVTGMLEVRFSNGRTWEAVFEASELCLFGAAHLPAASPPVVEFYTDMATWITFVDDYVVDMYKRPRDLVGLKAFTARLKTFLNEDRSTVAVPLNGIERALSDLWLRATSIVPAPMHAAFIRDFIVFVEGDNVWELGNLIQDRVPDPIDYLDMRQKSHMAELPMMIGTVGLVAGLPADLIDSLPMRELVELCGQTGFLRNDLHSYRREIVEEGEVHNGLLVLQRFLGCDLQRAADLTNEILTARMRRIEQVIAVDLPALADEFQLDEMGRAALHEIGEVAAALKAGDALWYDTTRRFDPPPPQAPSSRLFIGPAGLGTSAARIFRKALVLQ